MTENKASETTPEAETELTKEQQKIRKLRPSYSPCCSLFVHESKNVSTIAKAFDTNEQTIFVWSRTAFL